MKYAYCVLLALICLGSTSGYAQDEIDSLMTLADDPKAAKDTNLVNTISELCWQLHLIGRDDEGMPYLDRGIKLAKELKHFTQEGIMLRIKGDYYLQKKNFSKAIQSYGEALAIEEKVANKSKMALCYRKLSSVYIMIEGYGQAAASLDEELKLTKELKDTIRWAGVLISYWDLYYKSAGNSAKAAEYIDQLNSLAIGIVGDSIRASVYHTMGTFYFDAGDFDKAAEFLTKAMKLYEFLGDKKSLPSVYFDIGTLYEEGGNYQKSLEYSIKILKIRETLGDKSSLALAHNNVGWGYQLTRDFEKAMEHQLKAFKYYKELGDEPGLAYPLGNLGIIYNELGDPVRAINYSRQAMELFQEADDLGGVAEAHNNIGIGYYKLGKYDDAIENLKMGLAISRKEGIDYEAKNSYNGLAQCYEKLGDFKKAHEFFSLFVKTRDTIINRENSDRINRMNFLLENEKNQKAIELLHKDAQLRESDLKTQRLLIWSAAAVIALVLVLMFFIYRGLKQKQKDHLEILTKKREIEKSYDNAKLLGQIGKEITSSLSVDDIIVNMYHQVNGLLDASSFWIGIYNEEEQKLDYPIGIEKGEKLPAAHYSLTDKSRMAVWCFLNQKEVMLNDFQKEYNHFIPDHTPSVPVVGDSPESSIWYPLFSKNKKPIGVLTIQSFKKNAYTDYHLNLVKSLAVFTSIAIENALMYEEVEDLVEERTLEVVKQKEEIERSYQNVKLLSDIGRDITASLRVEEIIEKVYESVNRLMNAPIILIGIYNEEKNQLIVPGAIEDNVKQPVFHYDLNDKGRPAVWCFDHQQELIINDYRADYKKYFPGKEAPAAVAGADPESVIYFPLTSANKKIGVISFQSFTKNSYSEYHIDIIRSLAIYVSTALENARLYGNMEDEVKARTLEIEKQRDELARLSIVASETDNAVMITDAEGNIEWINAGYTRLTGYTLEELIELRGKSIIDASNHPEISLRLDDCIKHSKSVTYEIENQVKGGKNIWVQTTLTPIINNKGKVINLVAIDSDITELKRVEVEIKNQNLIISEKNKHITDSINYAKRIQEAILPPGEMMKSVLPEAFVLFKPKDIVSGDFYWVAEKAGKLFFAVLDCTGHGVPGAFVSIIGHNGLYRSINEFGLVQPSKILDKLNDLVEETFGGSTQTQIQDGMDIALCSFDPKSRKLEFSGANNPLYLISNGTLNEIKGDKQPIGAYEHRKKFTNHSVQLQDNESIYIFSDGYADQFGGPKKKKLKYGKFKEILLSMQNRSMAEQGNELDELMTNWKGDLEQIDDICVLGARI